MSLLNHVSWLEGSFPVRQTVAFGPDTSGAPNFLPASGASLTLTGQNVTSGVPLVMSAAQGCSKEGTVDVNYTFTTNPVWASLTASSTLYLYVNTATGATGFTTLVPIYQYGGTPATTSGQFTFNYGTMMGFMGNGTTAPATPIVFIGEAVTGASTITSTIAYAYNGFYDSGFTATLPAGSTVVNKTPNIGLMDVGFTAILQCTTADNGYAIGDQSYLITSSVWSAVVNRNSFGIATHSSSLPALVPKAGGTAANLTAASWKYKFVVKRAW